MTNEQKEWFEKGRVYEQEYARQLAEEKNESLVICLLERAMRGPGEMYVSDLDLMLAKKRFVYFISKDVENLGIKLRLVKEPN